MKSLLHKNRLNTFTSPTHTHTHHNIWNLQVFKLRLPAYWKLGKISFQFNGGVHHTNFKTFPYKDHSLNTYNFFLVLFFKINNIHVYYNINHYYRDPNLGRTTKVKGCKDASQERDPGVTSHIPGSAKSVRAWTLTLPSELPCWELESRMDSQIFRVQLQGSKLIASKSFLCHWKDIET
jgi:hypothetical protein